MRPDDVDPTAISVDELECRRALGLPMVLLDVRSSAEFVEAHVEGARNVDGAEVPSRLDELRGRGLVVTVCTKGGGRSSTAAGSLRDWGVPSRYLSGGTRAWLERSGSTPAVGSDCARAALGHSDAGCRVAAIEALADSTDPQDWRTILETARDPSARVRSAVAGAIGERGWDEGLDTLVLLLDDRDGSDTFPVARAAARALAAFSPLPGPVAERILAFLRAGEAGCADIVVHHALVAAIPASSLRDAWPLLRHLLCLPWVMEGPHDSGAPLRYAASWRLLCDVEVVHDILDVELLSQLARSPDDRTAAPALVLVGAAGGTVQAPDDRAVLVEAGAALLKRPRRRGRDLAPMRVLDAVLGNRAELDWLAYLTNDREARAWLEDPGSSPVTRAILWCLHRLADERVRPLLPVPPERDDELVVDPPPWASPDVEH